MTSTPPIVFGPVNSRRLGRSLGVDLVPRKVCTIDCVYCQVGATTVKTLDRRLWVPTEAALSQLEEALARETPDAVTFSGSGEPTLHLEIGRVIEAVKARFTGPVCVLTNGTLLSSPAVREELLPADRVMPSLDAGDPETFARINRPHPDLVFEKIVEGLRAFRQEYSGNLRLEVFFVRGVNDDDRSVKNIARIARSIRPDAVELNTVTRKPLASPVEGLSRLRLEELLPLFGEGAEVIASPDPPEDGSLDQVRSDEDIYILLRRRPCTAEEISLGLSMEVEAVTAALDRLTAQCRITPDTSGSETVYRTS